jgi:hypothetical protein
MSAEAAARRPNSLRYSRDLVWVHFRFSGRPLSGPSWYPQLSDPHHHALLLFQSLVPATSEPITFAPQHRGIQCKHGAFSTIPLPLPFLVDSQGNCSSGEILAQAGQLLMVMQIVLRHNRRHQHRRPHCDHAGSPTNDHRRLYRRLHFAVRQGLQEEASGQHERQAPGAGSTRPSASGSSSRSW